MIKTTMKMLADEDNYDDDGWVEWGKPYSFAQNNHKIK